MSSFKSSASATPLDRVRVADQIFHDLRDRIVRGELPNGAKLPAERDLAEQYQVSGPTVREAIRGLTAMGLADVRHGSGTYVTADAETMVALSLGAVIQLGALGVPDVLSILGVLNVHAVEQATALASPLEREGLRQALATIEAASTAKEAAAAVRAFHRAIATAAHNPLLAALTGFLADIQTELGMELTGDSIEEWRKILSKLKAPRTGMVEAIITGDREGAVALARDFHTKAAKLITSLPKAQEVRLTDPKLGGLLSSMMGRIG